MVDVMTRDLLTVIPDESVLMAWELMHQARCHHLPVVDDEGYCLGVLDAQSLAATWETGGPDRARKPVTAVLKKHTLATVHPDDRLSTAARAMLQQEADHIAVTGSRGLLVGLITANDLIATLAGVWTDPRRGPGGHTLAVTHRSRAPRRAGKQPAPRKQDLSRMSSSRRAEGGTGQPLRASSQGKSRELSPWQ